MVEHEVLIQILGDALVMGRLREIGDADAVEVHRIGKVICLKVLECPECTFIEVYKFTLRFFVSLREVWMIRVYEAFHKLDWGSSR